MDKGTIRHLVTGFVLLLMFNACGSKNQEKAKEKAQTKSEQKSAIRTSEKDTTGKDASVKEKDFSIVCLWQGTPVRSKAGKKGDWVTSLNMGEVLAPLGKTKEVEVDGKQRKHIYVGLKGGDKGWVQANLVAEDAKPAAVKKETAIYERPDLMAKSDNKFYPMDVVAVMEKEDNWVKVKGKSRKSDWFKSGWVKKDKLIENKVDITTAVYIKKALGKEDTSEIISGLKEVKNNSDLSESQFTASLDTLMENYKQNKVGSDNGSFSEDTVATDTSGF